MATRPVRKSAPSARPVGAATRGTSKSKVQSTPAAKTPAKRQPGKKAPPSVAPKPVAKGKRRSPAKTGIGPSSVSPPRAPDQRPSAVASMPRVERARDEMSAAASRLALVTARDLMRDNVVTVNRDATLAELAEILSDHRITGAPVTDRQGTIIGVVSMRDLIDAYSDEADSRPRNEPTWFERPFEFVLEQEESSSYDGPTSIDKTVGDIMTYNVVSVPANAGVRDIARTMTERRVHRVLVERDGELGAYVGIIGTFEILDMLAE